MKVLHIIPTLRAGGAEKLSVDLLVSMKNQGIDAELLILDGEDSRFMKPLAEKEISVTISSVKNAYSVRQIREIREIVGRSHPDIVHAHLFPAQLWSACSLHSLEIPLITTEHSTYNRRRKHLLCKILDCRMYGKYRRIICNSLATKKALEEWLPELSLKTVLIYNGIAEDVYAKAEPYPKRSFIPGDPDYLRVIVKVSRFTQAKDHTTVIRALSILPDRYHLLLVGEGPKETETRRWVESIGVSKRVHFLGVREDVPRVLKTADILVQSSHWEGFGLSVVEGMAAGLPVIVSETPGLAETFANSVQTFPRGDAKALSERILNLESPSLYENQKEKSLAAAKKFGISGMVSEYVKVYNQVLEEKL